MAVNESSGFVFTVSFFDEDGAAFAPTNVQYRLDDKLSTNELIAWTDITPATQVTINIPASAHAMVDASLAEEVKVLTVETDYGTDVAHNEEYEYIVTNLQFVT